MCRKAVALTLISLLSVLALAGNLAIQNNAESFIAHGELYRNSNIVFGNANASVTMQSPENKTYNTSNVAVAFSIESKVPPLDYFTGSLFGHFFRYGCYLDYDVISNQSINWDNWNQNKPGFIPNSNVNTTISKSGDFYVCNANLTHLSEGPHEITTWVKEESDYLSYSEPVGSVFSMVFFNIDTTSPNPTASTSPTPTVPELSWLVIVPLLLSIFAVAVVMRHRKTKSIKMEQLSQVFSLN
jgi:hypothetical protein